MWDFFEKYHLSPHKIAAGVSGGADSLALVLKLFEWGKSHNCQIVALSVDHGLRPESRDEALYVGKLMQKLGIEHHILTWEGDKPSTGIEEAAREARYRLVLSWCLENNVKFYATGHHMRDQAETFWLRLIRGSGVFGLSGIAPVSQMKGVTIIRPLLEYSPEELKDYLKAHNIAWVEDPSNQNEDFLRVKIRKFLPTLEKELGLSVKRVADTCAVLRQTKSFMDDVLAHLWENDVCSFDNVGTKIFYYQFLSLHDEIKFYLLSQMIKYAGGLGYAPEADEVLRLVDMLKHSDFSGATLGGCEIFLAQNSLWVVREIKNKFVLSKSQWAEFVLKHQEYRRLELPYKLRLALVNEWMNQNRS